MTRQQRNTLIFALALLAALVAAFFVQRWLFQSQGTKAVVKVGGLEDRVVSLSQDQEFWVGNAEIGRNLVRVEDGAIMVAQADCPDKVCVQTGPIRQEGQVIACLPHGVIIYIQHKEG